MAALLEEKRARAAGLKAIPGDPGPPLVHQNLALLRGTAFFDLSYYLKYGEVYWSKGLGRTQVSAAGPNAIGEILVNKDKGFGSEPGWTFLIGPFFERGVMLLDFEEHHDNRHIMNHAFTRPRLVGYLDAMTPTMTRAVESWGSTEDFRFYPAIKNLGLDIAVQTFMGDHVDSESSAVMKAFQDCVQAATAIVRRDVPGLRWHRGLAGRKVLERYVGPRVQDARHRDGEDLLSALCHAEGENGERFTDRDVLNHIIFLILAAHDTTTSALTAMTYYLGKDPEWQARCREESLSLDKEALEYDDVDKLTSLDLVMKEAMRLQPPLPGLAREAVKDTSLCGHFVPRGTMVGVGISVLHRLPSIWTNPEAFDPDRFSDERREDKAHRFAYLPFGGGVHKCIGMYFAGMEAKSVMHQMLRTYEWTLPSSYEMPMNWKALPIPKDGLPVQLRRR
ncbi:MAG TPA: cytochrome P450 [Nocardioidaceae bacterium]|nr:cytochrome P450 [Nocardioidaceae bacterium]